MKQFKIVQVGNPRLRKLCSDYTESEIKSKETKELVKRMKYTLRKVGGIGLAAPQVGVNRNLCIIRIHPTKYRPNIKKVPVYAMFNPKVIKTEGKHEEGWEGCFSVANADLFMKVKRPQSIEVSYFDEMGVKKAFQKSGLEAVVVQHEIDHLNGLVYLDKNPDLNSAINGEEYRLLQDKKA